jgi:DNA-binding response OmpR family regulator
MFAYVLLSLEREINMAMSDDVKNILVVEDEPYISNLCERVLSGEGHNVSVATDGQMAEEMLNKNRYDLCIIDIRTPVMNGKELYNYINEKHRYLLEGVIFTTGDIIGGETQGFLESTGRAYVLKPFAPEELRTVVREALQSIV